MSAVEPRLNLHERSGDRPPRVVTVQLPTWAELVTRSVFVARVWWLWLFTKVIPDVFWFFALPFVDKRGEGLSLTRFMVIATMVLIFHVVESPTGSHNPITANIVWVLAMCFAVAFGKSTFTYLLSRWSRGDTTQTVDVVTTDTAKVIEAIKGRRDAAASEGAEAAR